MTKKKQKLELTWIGKDKRPKLEPRILIEDQEKSYHARERRSDDDIFDNMLIHGDNLLALKALEQEYAGKVKCIYIDPPYNTGAAFEHYNDGLEHSLWLTLMRDRLHLFHELLSDDGLIFVQIDYREGARLKCLMDEVFGENCFKNEIIVRRGTKNVQSQFETIDALSVGHDTIFLYAKAPATRMPKLMAFQDDAEPGKWDTFWRGTDRKTMRYELFGITPETGQWRWAEARAKAAKRNYEIYKEDFEKSMSLDEYYGLKLQETGEKLNLVRKSEDGTVQYYVPPRNYKMVSDVWMDVRTSGKFSDFPHEKHEELLERIIRWSTNPGDIVLDSFAGSGSTGATAQKMRRRWIMVELGDHCETHTAPRLKAVIDGNDPGGITEAVDWKGGGGFRYFRLAPSLLEQDKYGNWVISQDYKPEMLAEAMCKHMGFTYAPSQNPDEYWNHGYSTETDFIFITTQNLTHQALAKIAEDVGPDRSLLICCKAFNANPDAFENLTIQKIPHAVLKKCEWGRDDYSLNVANLPMAAEDEEEDAHPSVPPDDLPLFATEDTGGEG